MMIKGTFQNCGIFFFATRAFAGYVSKVSNVIQMHISGRVEDFDKNLH